MYIRKMTALSQAYIRKVMTKDQIHTWTGEYLAPNPHLSDLIKSYWDQGHINISKGYTVQALMRMTGLTEDILGMCP